MSRVLVVVGGQYGSEGKGHVTAQLTGGRDAVVRVAGPNAGHSAYDREGRLWKLRQIPVGAVHTSAPVVLAAGSEIDPQVLSEEVAALDGAGHAVSTRLHIDAQATVIDPKHKTQEAALVGAVGSTGKGVGAARADRLMRTARLYQDLEPHPHPTDTASMLATWISNGGNVVVEGTQGYGLGLHAGHYPQCTSSDCRAVDMLAMAGISPWAPGVRLDVVVVARVFPIRVAGNSGPMKGETTWEQLGLPVEHTTVTGKVRRVGEWDPDLAKRAVEANGGRGCTVALTMVDHMFPQTVGVTDPRQIDSTVMQFVRQVEAQCGTRVGYLGTSPTTLVRLP